jgi:uncharacterized membrane protein SpoIIM required for sporulation
LGPTARAFLIALALFLVTIGLGCAYALGNPASGQEQFRKVVSRLPSRLSLLTIFLHNVTRPFIAATPYILAKLFFLGRRNLLTKLLALIPLAIVVVNGYILGLVLVVSTYYGVPRAFGCPAGSLSALLVTLSLILPHGVFEITAILLLTSIPLAVEFGEKFRRAIALTFLGVILLAVAAFIEVYITGFIGFLVASSLCHH